MAIRTGARRRFRPLQPGQRLESHVIDGKPALNMIDAAPRG
jgi:hypothetical protein